jgi:anti-sigma-K factor RskA
MTCDEIDQLSGAYALDALSGEERRAVEAHMASCPQPHGVARGLAGAGAFLSAGVEPMTPTAGLRDRILASADATPQEDRAAGAAGRQARAGWPRWVAVATAAALVGMAVLTGTLWFELQSRNDQLEQVARIVAQGGTVQAVSGEAGSGYLVDPPREGATLILADVRPIPSDRLYELWLLSDDGSAVPVGTFVPGNGPVAVIPVEQDLVGYATLALTVERERVGSPTGDPVLVAPIAR